MNNFLKQIFIFQKISILKKYRISVYNDDQKVSELYRHS